MSNTIHPSAIVSPNARLGSGNQIGPFVHIHDDVELGDDNVLMSGAVIKPGVRMGNHNSLHEHAVLGGEPQDLGFDGHTSYVEIGNGNVFRENVTVHRGAKAGDITRLGNDNFLMANVHIGHNCQLHNNIVIAPSTGLGGFVTADDRAFISGGVMVHQFVNIGRFAMIGGNTKVTQDCLPFMITDGVPARVRGLNVVGLRRGGVGRDSVRALKQAYQLLFNNALSLEQRLEKIAQLDDELTQHMVTFIGNAKRGFHRNKPESN